MEKISIKNILFGLMVFLSIVEIGRLMSSFFHVLNSPYANDPTTDPLEFWHFGTVYLIYSSILICELYFAFRGRFSPIYAPNTTFLPLLPPESAYLDEGGWNSRPC